MKKLLFALIFVLILSFVSAEEVNCIKQSENVFAGNIPFNSFCEIPLEDYKGKIKVEIGEGYYAASTNFSIPVNVYIALEDSFFDSNLKKEVQLKCSNYFGKTLNLSDSDSFPYEQECAFKDKIFGLGLTDPLITLSINVSNAKPPFNDVKIEITTKFTDNLVKKYLAKRFSSFIKSNDSRNIFHEFYFEYEKEKINSDLISNTVVKFNLDSVNYKEEKAVFRLTNAETGKDLCSSITDIYMPSSKFFDCDGIADIRISAKEGNPKEYYKKLRYYFTVALTPKDPALVGGKAEVKPADKIEDKPDDKKDQPVPTNLTELQKQINNSILIQYNKIMGVN